MKGKVKWILIAGGAVVALTASCCLLAGILGTRDAEETRGRLEAPAEGEDQAAAVSGEGAQEEMHQVPPIPPPPLADRADEAPGLLAELETIEPLRELAPGTAATRRFLSGVSSS